MCDVYGAGYFYIPGTETCLRIGGYVRYDIGAGDVGTFTGARADDVVDGKNQGTFYKDSRFTLKTWTGQETELGTLKTYTETRLNFQNSPFDNRDGNDAHNNIDEHFAWLQLGGLRVGLDESAFDTFVGYAGNVINDTIVPYGGFKTGVVQYYFDAGNGFSAMASLEEGSGGGAQHPNLSGSYGYGVGTIDSYVPHVVGGVKYTQGWGDVVGVVAYDSNYEYVSGKVRVDVNVSNALTLFGMFGYASEGKLNDTGFDPANGRGFYKPWGGHWGFWGGGTYKFNEKTSFNLQVSGDQWKDYGVAANIAYTVVPGLTITPEVDYQHVGSGAIDAGNVWAGGENGKKNVVGGIIRFQRDF